MNAIAKQAWGSVRNAASGNSIQQQWRGIQVKVYDGNLERALVLMERKMTSSGMERLIKRQVTHHLKNSEKRVLAKKNLMRRVQAIDLARKMQAILMKKVRGV